jgi:DNA invertase Pin-like site-specific DNA recombinase
MKRINRKHPVDEPEVILWHGYARVSTDDQDLRMQIEALTRAGVEPDRIYQDKASGKSVKRTGLQDMLAHVRGGEGIMVWRFDRLSRSIRDLIMLFDDLEARGIQLKSIHEQLDTTTPMGRLMFQLAGILAEFERNLIAERTRLGMETAKRRGTRFGPKPRLTEAKLQRAIVMLRSGQPVGVVARRMGVANVTLREKVLKVTGKRLWPKGPRSKR